MKVLSVVGARPQFVKAAVLSRAVRQRHQELLVHTGQHYDDAMSGQFFRELGLPRADYELNVGSGSHGRQTGAMLVGLEDVIVKERPDAVLVLGDTNSTLAGALAAVKLRVPVAHVEAGLRSFNRAMPEEINRVTVDHLSDWLFCPSDVSANHLATEGIVAGVHVVGDLMAEATEAASAMPSPILERLGVNAGRYLLATIHRAENTDDPARLMAILNALARLDETVVFPVHPRTRKMLDRIEGAGAMPLVHMIEPVGYVDMSVLERHARMILTDSGGVQKEAYWLGVPCVTLRDETEWTETVDLGWNILTGAEADRIVAAVRSFAPPSARPPLYVRGRASELIASVLEATS